MHTEIVGKPSFGYINVDLEPGETLIAESDAMASMSADLSMQAKFNGGLFSGLGKKFLGRESLFVNEFCNNRAKAQRVTLAQRTPGDICSIELNDETFYLQPGAYIASTAGVDLDLGWAGFASFIGREGLFRLKVKGTGTVWFGAYGGILERDLEGEIIVDTSHLVGYSPGVGLSAKLAGGIFSSFFGGEGLVTRLEGQGKYYIQTRSIAGLASWLNPKIV